MAISVIRTQVAINMARSTLKKAEIKKPPISVREVADKAGIAIHYYFHSELDFPFVIKKGNRFVICVPLGEERQERFWIGTQLGHILLGHFELLGKSDTILEDRLSEEERNVLEKEAEIFASELILPTDWLWKNWNISRKKDPIFLSKLFDVPLDFILPRLQQLEESQLLHR